MTKAQIQTLLDQAMLVIDGFTQAGSPAVDAVVIPACKSDVTDYNKAGLAYHAKWCKSPATHA
jgi:hypothetical protein